mmetsp:Transcript_36431/g.73093  ORF Transcript_36431/g.73093 Transcript_36431/m.73093 type:complete len:89 (-) Transcript_36431:81-347(-)
MERLQGIARRAALVVPLENLEFRVLRAALVDPRMPLSGEVDLISIVAQGSAARYKILPTLDDPAPRAAPGLVPLLAAVLALLTLRCHS